MPLLCLSSTTRPNRWTLLKTPPWWLLLWVLGLPRGGPYTTGSVRGSNCHFSCCRLSRLYLIVFTTSFVKLFFWICKLGNNTQEFYLEPFKFSSNIAPCVHKLSCLGRFIFGYVRGAFRRLERREGLFLPRAICFSVEWDLCNFGRQSAQILWILT